jgi:hypothetical protein
MRIAKLLYKKQRTYNFEHRNFFSKLGKITNAYVGVRKSDEVPEHKSQEHKSQELRKGDKESPKVNKSILALKVVNPLYTCPRTPFYRETKGLLHSENALESKE